MARMEGTRGGHAEGRMGKALREGAWGGREAAKAIPGRMRGGCGAREGHHTASVWRAGKASATGD